MLNHIDIIGRMTKDPELRRTQSGTPVCSVTLACDRDFKNKDGSRDTDFVTVVAWRNTAEYLSKYGAKGRMTAAIGRIETRNYTDKNGDKRTAVEVVADNVYFMDSAKKNDQQFADDFDDDEDVPF